MRLRSDQLPARITGTLFGIGYAAIGLFALLGSFDQVDPVVRDRAFWFGFTSLVVGLVAIGLSWVEARLDTIWCADPRRRARLKRR